MVFNKHNVATNLNDSDDLKNRLKCRQFVKFTVTGLGVL